MNKLGKYLIVAVVIGFLFWLVYPSFTYSVKSTEIIFFNAKKGDSILLKNQDLTILIDTGLKEDEKKLADSLKTLGVKNIDYLILTHPDKDHIGGASFIIDSFKINTIIQSAYIKGSKAEARIKTSLINKPVNNIILKETMRLEVDNLIVDIIVGREKDYIKSNDNSLITLVQDGDLTYLFAADAEKALLSELIGMDLPQVDLYKVAHHGKYNSLSEAMIKKISKNFCGYK